MAIAFWDCINAFICFPVQFTIAAKNAVISITGLGLSKIYNVAQFHFHWGSEDDQGSEHTYNGDAYPMEVRNLKNVICKRTNS